MSTYVGMTSRTLAESDIVNRLLRLTIGPPCGRIKELSAKVKAINDKYGPFEALLCLGDLFAPYDHEGAELSQSESDLLDGTLVCEFVIDL